MIPVTQTKMVVKNSKDEMIVRGNCLAACVASLFEIPITEVPNVEVLFHIEDNYYYFVLNKWLNSFGYEISTDDRFKVYHDKDYLKDNQRRRAELRVYLQDEYYLVSGKSARGVNHVCVYKKGKLVHDPHPSREGLLTEEYFQSIEKINAGSNCQ